LAERARANGGPFPTVSWANAEVRFQAPSRASGTCGGREGFANLLNREQSGSAEKMGRFPMTITTAPLQGRIVELATYFLRLGLLGFGGPVALVGQMERELVADRGWLSKEEMREAIAICQSLPGPLAIQVGIYVAYLRCGF
jgi:Chromate transporter